MDPTPVQSLITRLNTQLQDDTNQPRMKLTDNLPEKLKYSGSKDDWFEHMDNLELDVFQKHGCNAMQAYFDIKASLTKDAEEELRHLETRLSTPKFERYIPWWYNSSKEDLTDLLHKVPFQSLRYPLRVAILYRYFHHKFQRSDPLQAMEDFRRTVQKPGESVVSWVTRLKKEARKLKRYRSEIPFHTFADQLLVGTKLTSFEKEFRRLVKPTNPSVEPSIVDKASFDRWFDNWTEELNDRSRQESRRRGIAAEIAKAPGDRMDNSSKRKRRPLHRHNLQRKLFPAPSERKPLTSLSSKQQRRQTTQPRLPHSNLQKAFRPVKKDLSHIECFNCGEKGHYASKCPQPKKAKSQAMKAYLCGLQEGKEMGEHHDLDERVNMIGETLTAIVENFSSQVQAMVASFQHTEAANLPNGEDEDPTGDDEDGEISRDEEVEKVEADHAADAELSDGESAYSYSNLRLIGRSGGLSMRPLDVTSKPSEVLAFRDLVDLPEHCWSWRLQCAGSRLCDLMLPVLRTIFARWDLGQIPEEDTYLAETQKILMLSVLLVVGTGKTLHEPFQALTSTAFEAWTLGRRASRYIEEHALELAEAWSFRSQILSHLDLEMTHMLSLTQDPTQMAQLTEHWANPFSTEGSSEPAASASPASALRSDATDVALEKKATSGSRNFYYAVVGRLNSSGETIGITMWRSEDPFWLPEGSNASILFEGASFLECESYVEGILQTYPSAADLRMLITVHDLVPDAQSREERSILPYYCIEGVREDWSKFAKLTRRKAGSQVISAAARIFIPDADGKEATPKDQLRRVLTTTENNGSFACVSVGKVVKSWYHDPGSTLCQIDDS